MKTSEIKYVSKLTGPSTFLVTFFQDVHHVIKVTGQVVSKFRIHSLSNLVSDSGSGRIFDFHFDVDFDYSRGCEEAGDVFTVLIRDLKLSK